MVAPSATPVWVWLISGIFVGSILAVALFFYDSPLPSRGSAQQAPTESRTQTRRKLSPADYRLPDLQPGPDARAKAAGASSDESDLAAHAAAQPAGAQPPPSHKPRGPTYWLQAGAFRSAAQADSLKARLTLSGLPVRVFGAQVRGQQWYRVRVGPFHDRTAVDQGKARLRGQKITQPTLIRERG